MIQRVFLILAFTCGPLTAADKPMDVRECRVRACQALWMISDFKKAADYFNAGLAQDPNDYETNLDFGMAYLTYCQPPDLIEARKHFEAAAKIEKNVFNQDRLEHIAFTTNDLAAYDKYRISVSDLLRAGKDIDVQVRTPDLEFGRQQYAAMLESVPEMKLYVPKEGWLSKWAAEKFAGVGLRTHVKWKTGRHMLDSPEVTVDDDSWAGDMALFIGLNDKDRIGQSGFRLSESYWESFVFEMLNDQHRERTTWIWMLSRALKMGDLAYGAQNRAYEQQTDLEVNNFYFDHWKPYCDQMGLPTDQALWSPRNVFPEEAVCKVFTGYDKAYLDQKSK
jgi:hypothetical protein